MEKAQINLSSDLAAISTYNTMLKAFLANETVPTGYLIDDHAIAMGIQKDLLPSPMKGLYLDGISPMDIKWAREDQLRDCPIVVAYDRKFDKKRLSEILEDLSVNIKYGNYSLLVSDSEGLIGVYGINRLKLPREGLERFLKLAPPSLTGINQDCFLE